MHKTVHNAFKISNKLYFVQQNIIISIVYNAIFYKSIQLVRVLQFFISVIV